MRLVFSAYWHFLSIVCKIIPSNSRYHQNVTHLVSMNILVLLFHSHVHSYIYVLANWSVWAVLQEVNEIAQVPDDSLEPRLELKLDIWDIRQGCCSWRTEDKQQWLKKLKGRWRYWEECSICQIICYGSCRACWSGANNIHIMPAACSLLRIYKELCLIRNGGSRNGVIIARGNSKQI